MGNKIDSDQHARLWGEQAITVWQDGTWTVWSIDDAYQAQSRPDWFTTIPMRDITREVEWSDV